MDQSNRSVHGTLAKIGVEPGKVEAKKVYRIDARDAFAVYCDNAEFRFAINTGMFRHAQNRFVIDNEKYVYRTPGGVYRLTQYAWGHLDECALVFVDRWAFREPPKVMYRRVYTGERERRPRYEYNAGNGASIKIHEAEFREAFVDEYNTIAVMSKTFTQRVMELMAGKGWDLHKFMRYTRLDQNHYYKIMQGKLYNPTMETILNICIGLQLPSTIRDELIALSGHSWQNTQLHYAYRYVLERGRVEDVTEFNRLFAILGIDPDGRLPLRDDAWVS